MKTLSLCIAAFLWIGCNHTTQSGDGFNFPDLALKGDLAEPPAPPDLSADLVSLPDFAVEPDLVALPPGTCVTGGDCRLFDSYCTSAPCACLALAANEPDPICNGGMVTCFVQPCFNKTAVCTQGTCEAVVR